MMKFAFKELSVWHKSIEIAEKVIRLIDNIESDRKHFRLFEQLEAAVTSVSSNIAEGKGRNSKKEFIQYLYIARGSLYETISLLNIYYRVGWIDESTLRLLEGEGLEVVRMIKGLINSIQKSL